MQVFRLAASRLTVAGQRRIRTGLPPHRVQVLAPSHQRGPSSNARGVRPCPAGYRRCMSDADTPRTGHVDPQTAAQLDEADSRAEAPPQSAPGPDPMSQAIEDHDEATSDADPESLTEGQEW